MNDVYFGRFVRFDTVSKKEATQLVGSDNLVGDVYEIEFRLQDRLSVAWLKNRFGVTVGFFDQQVSRQLSIFEARGWKICAILALVAFTEDPDPGHYWGECALICYDPQESDTFDVFLAGIAKRIAEGMRPDVDLNAPSVAKVLESQGSWSPMQYRSLPKQDRGTVFIKTRRSIKEKLVEQARAGNKGCYIANWVVLLAIAGGLFFLLRACGVF